MASTAYLEAEVARLEAALTRLHAQYHSCAAENVLQPGSDARTLRENWRAEENRREGLAAIGQSIDGAGSLIAMYRRMLAE